VSYTADLRPLPPRQQWGMVGGMRVFASAYLTAFLVLLGPARLAADQAPSAAPREPSSEERSAWRAGLVSIERNGKRLATGTVLSGDGRMVTLLSALGHGNGLVARYSSGAPTQVRVVLHNRAWDVALLAPLQRLEKRGLKAAKQASGGAVLSRLGLRGTALQLLAAGVEGDATLLGHDGQKLEGALLLKGYVAPSDWGGPIIDTGANEARRGRVTAIVARACAPNQKGKADAPCRLIPYGVPVEVLRRLLEKAPPAPTAWLGVEVLPSPSSKPRGALVEKVIPGGPAAAAGLVAASGQQEGDVVVAVDGRSLKTPRDLLDTVAAHQVGDELSLLVYRGGEYRTVRVSLALTPPVDGEASRSDGQQSD